jgi:hypothetical protein
VKRFFFALGLCALPAAGQAQVIVHQAALDQLAGIAPPPMLAPMVAPVVSHKIVHHPAARWHLVVKRVHLALIPADDAAKPLAAKPAPPPVVKVVAKSGPYMPAPPSTPPVKVAVAQPAPTLPALPGAVVLRFGANASDLPGTAAAALIPVCKAAGQGDMVAIDAYAPADPADPSAAMRLSMSRAFAVRDALTACGVPSTKIFPRADGAAGDVTTARITLARGAQN